MLPRLGTWVSDMGKDPSVRLIKSQKIKTRGRCPNLSPSLSLFLVQSFDTSTRPQLCLPSTYIPPGDCLVPFSDVDCFGMMVSVDFS